MQPLDFTNRKPIIELKNNDLLNQPTKIVGWVKNIRKLGNFNFIEIADKSGLIQLLDKKNEYASLSREDLVLIEGLLQLKKDPNKNLELGDREVLIDKLTIISKSKTPPFIIEDETDALEEVRLKYRYLDLRRPVLQRNMKLRSDFFLIVRNFLASMNFTEIETPILSKTTPEGARDYVVPSRCGPNMFYALPQSAQIYKQLLMISGFERYFQISRCFRDEDLRKDRQPEHVQIDMEVSFMSKEEFFTLIEKMFVHVFDKLMNIKIEPNFIRMKFDDAMNLYGTDKPDLRFGCELTDVSKTFKEHKFEVFKNFANKNLLKAIVLDDILVSSKEHKVLEKYAKDNHAKALSWFSYENNEIIDGSIKRFIDRQDLTNLGLNDKKGTIFFVGDDSLEVINKSLGAVRTQLNEIYQLANEDEYKFLWIVDWPLYEWDEKENKYVSAHNLFTSPDPSCIDTFNEDKKNARASSYDLVLNGFELGSGAIRITNPKLQEEVMESLGLSKDEAYDKFGFLLDAYQYGAPQHCGIGLGSDRILMILTKSKSIRDIIAFPKNNQGFDLMNNSPSEAINEQFLNELYLSIKNK
ncbi:aspartate--tRNA ligase [Mycoplasma sp. T363T]|uniref:aspartate--tRNA ligase n=1 Tax=Mycoplasma bradburyae TaxID=2963128 RepID=UPI002340A510|nr:aspartate--tRNA ligase [Mycoplasma bradburyae]MDC4163538.1 aspartate--tRNA ligase [Mycoplasma bradburyae]